MTANGTDATSAPHGVAFPPGRYGRRRDPRARRRWVVWLVGLLVAAAGTAIAVRLYQTYYLAPYQVSVDKVDQITDHGVTVTFTVHRPAGKAASCTVRARAHDGVEVGRATVVVPAGDQERVTVTYTLATTARPYTGEVPGCGPG